MPSKKEKQDQQRIADEYLSKFLHKDVLSKQGHYPPTAKRCKSSTVGLQPNIDEYHSDNVVDQQSPGNSSRSTAASVYLSSFRSQPSPHIDMSTSNRGPVNIEGPNVRRHRERGACSSTQVGVPDNHHPEAAHKEPGKSGPASRPQDHCTSSQSTGKVLVPSDQ